MKKTIPISKVFCEPQMSNKGLYPTISMKDNRHFSQYLMDFLQYSDGKNDLDKISKLIGLNKKKILIFKNLLLKHKLISC
jgi:Uncharacterized protein conserved in bacteria with an aminopeptidase-like domain